MRRTRTTLSDGRALVYYDHEGAPERELVDHRPAAPAPAAPTLRRDPLLDEWVSVAAQRLDRTFLPTTDECPLCPSAPGRRSEVPGDYDVVVFDNRFPSFTGAITHDGRTGIHATHPAWGRCEVVCFTAEHGGSFAGLDTATARLVIDVWADRTEALSQDPAVEQVFVFENRGEAIGVTLHHPHGQIYGYPYVAPRSVRQLEVAARHRDATGRDLYADVVDAELADGSRVVRTSEHWIAFVPFAARWPIEVHLYPRRRAPDLAALDSAQRDDLAVVYLDLLRRADAFFGTPLPYIAAWHQAPVRTDRDLAALHLELFSVQRDVGRLKYLAGSESAMGAFVNDREPEAVAARLREVGRP
jgi:UDPglucose--hexose-1-phosphate uridylyltransferase